MSRDQVIAASVYYRVFAALMLLLALTVAAAFFDLGWLNPVLMLSIAGSKAALVILFFMHVYYSSRLTWLFAGAGLVWLVLLLALTLADYLTRTWETL